MEKVTHAHTHKHAVILAQHGVIIIIPYTGDGEEDNLSVVSTGRVSQLDECLLFVRVGTRSRFSCRSDDGIENGIDLWITVPDYSSLTVLLKGPSAAGNAIRSVYFDIDDDYLLRAGDIINRTPVY